MTNVKINVERRFHFRHIAQTQLKILTSSGKSKLCRAVNLSPAGVGVRTENFSLKIGESVQITFMVNLGQLTRLHRRLGRVAYVKNGITGLSLMTFAESTAAIRRGRSK